MSSSWYERDSREASWFERAVGEKSWLGFFALPPNVWVRGVVRNADGNELNKQQLEGLKWIISPVASAVEEIVLVPPFDRYKVSTPKVFPKTVIDLNGMWGPHTRMSGEPRLVIPLGMMLTVQSLPETFDLLDHILASERDIARLDRFQPPRKVVREVGRLIEAWDASSRSGWKTSVILGSLDTSPRGRIVSSILVGHELGHAFEAIYTDAVWAQKMKEVEEHYRSWLNEEKILLNSTVMNNVRRLLRDQNILGNWVRESLADDDAYEYAFASLTHGHWIRGTDELPYLREVYVAMAILFSLLGLWELYNQSRGMPPDVMFTTHPSALARPAVWCHIQAKKVGLSQEAFLSEQFGAGMVVLIAMAKIFGKVVGNPI